MSRNQIAALHLGTNPFIGHSYVSTVHISLSDAEKEAILETCADIGVKGAVIQTTPELVELFSHYDFSLIGVVGSDLKPTKQFMNNVTTAHIMEEIHHECELLHRLHHISFCLHGIITDALIRAGRTDILAELIDTIGPAGAATHFPGSTLPSIEQSGALFCLCAFNPVGFMMKPSLQETLTALKKIHIPVIAKKVMAGGWLSLEQSIAFFKEHRALVNSCVIGVKSQKEARETFSAFKKFF